jgi:hypothetical protein
MDMRMIKRETNGFPNSDTMMKGGFMFKSDRFIFRVTIASSKKRQKTTRFHSPGFMSVRKNQDFARSFF